MPPDTLRPCALVELRLPHGGMIMSVPAPRLLTFQVWGHLNAVIADRMLELVEQRIATTERTFDGFHDWSEMDTYETQARLRLTSWVLERRSRFGSIHILSQSRLVSMGVAVANMALGRFIEAYGPGDRAGFEAALQASIAERSRQGAA